MWLFNRTTWDLVHTWAFVVMISAAILHFAIHWKWVTKVTTKIVNRFLRISPTAQQRLVRYTLSLPRCAMIKKILLWTLFAAFVGLIIFGAIYRTNAKLEDESPERRSQSKPK